MRVRYITTSTKKELRPPYETEVFEEMSNYYNDLTVEIISSGADVVTTEQRVIDGYLTIVRVFDNDTEVHLIPNTTKIQ